MRTLPTRASGLRLGRRIAYIPGIMLSDPLFVVVAIAALLVLGILLFGIGTFGRGGEFNRKYANKIMRARILAQFLAVVLILLFVLLRRQG